MRQVADGLITARRGAALVGLSPRQFRRLCRRYEADGDGAVIHGLRDRRSNRAASAELRMRVMARVQEAVFRDFGPTLLAEHLSRDPEIGELNAHTLRRWMIEGEYWKPRRRGARHRKARPRRRACGELIQWDSSEHAWFEDRAAGRQVLIQMHDDATNRLMMARFVPRDNGPANRQIAIDYLRRWGRPLAFYTDKAGHFGRRTRPGPRSDLPLEERDPMDTTSVIRAALRELNVELILAHSPQAKGRVERNFGTSQDRLVKELRVLGISEFEEANQYLEDVYIPFWNERFAVEPAEPRDVHRRLPKRFDLESLFAETLTRTIGHDFTITHERRKLQIAKSQARGIRPGHKLTIELRLDGSTRYRWKNRYLDLEVVAKAAPARCESNKPVVAKPLSPPPKPGPDHPWRQNNRLIANPRAVAQYRRTSAAAQPSLSTPSVEGVLVKP
ncbi:MAG: ISNCY family transposase [Phycisphaerales bacterium JB038]